MSFDSTDEMVRKNKACYISHHFILTVSVYVLTQTCVETEDGTWACTQ